MKKLPALLGSLPPRFQWTLHNLIGHPLFEILYQLGQEKMSNAIHNMTVPYPERKEHPPCP